MKNDTRVVSATAPGKIILSGEHAAVYGHPAVVFAVNLKSTATVSLAIKKVAKSNDEIPAVFIEKILSIFEDTFHVSTQNIALSLQTELPIQSGMGSSASLAAAAFKALALWFETTLSKEQLFTMVQETEKIFHGTPSGIDASAIVFGGLMSFQKLEGTYKREQIEIKNGIFPTFFLINSGKPVETTKEMVD
jgi:mevalonate kinase